MKSTSIYLVGLLMGLIIGAGISAIIHTIANPGTQFSTTQVLRINKSGFELGYAEGYYEAAKNPKSAGPEQMQSARVQAWQRDSIPLAQIILE